MMQLDLPLLLLSRSSGHADYSVLRDDVRAALIRVGALADLDDCNRTKGAELLALRVLHSLLTPVLTEVSVVTLRSVIRQREDSEGGCHVTPAPQ